MLIVSVMTTVTVLVDHQGKWDVPLPKVRAVGEDEVFKVVKTGKTRSELIIIFSMLLHNKMS